MMDTLRSYLLRRSSKVAFLNLSTISNLFISFSSCLVEMGSVIIFLNDSNVISCSGILYNISIELNNRFWNNDYH